MTPEEKAKAYDKAIEQLKEIFNCKEVKVEALERPYLEKLFPELKENEDERIRKELIKYFSEGKEYLSLIPYNKEECVAWLEKQSEQKPYGQREECLDCQFNYAGECKGFCSIKKSEQKPADKVEPKFHEGDWIIHYGTENIYKVVAIIDNQYQLKYGDNYTVQNCADVDRCARLWDIAKDAKYGDVLINTNVKYPFIFKQLKPSDIKTNIKKPLTVLGYCGIGGGGFTKSEGWGDTANCTYYPATKEQRDTLMKAMADAGYMWDSENKILLSLKAEPNSEQKPAEWNEEDEQYFNFLEKLLVILQVKLTEGEIKKGTNSNSEYYYKVIQWLKSLRLQKRWKPSEEQLDALRGALSHIPNEYDTPILTEIYEQLKQL